MWIENKIKLWLGYVFLFWLHWNSIYLDICYGNEGFVVHSCRGLKDEETAPEDQRCHGKHMKSFREYNSHDTKGGKVVSPVILDDRKYFWNQSLADNSWGYHQICVSTDLKCPKYWLCRQKDLKNTFKSYNEIHRKYLSTNFPKMVQKIFDSHTRMTERKIFVPPQNDTQADFAKKL